MDAEVVPEVPPQERIVCMRVQFRMHGDVALLTLPGSDLPWIAVSPELLAKNTVHPASIHTPPPVPPSSILAEADALVGGDRQKAYGHPYHDFTRTAAMWSAILGAPVTAKHVALCMCALKISRECNAHKRDNLVDLAGYSKTAMMVEEFPHAH